MIFLDFEKFIRFNVKYDKDVFFLVGGVFIGELYIVLR